MTAEVPSAAGLSGARPTIVPTPTDEEMAAIVAAVEMSWPQSTPHEAPSPAPSRWRFSGRWWTQLPAANRRRPRVR